MAITFKPPYQSMDNAPKNRVILTDQGTVCYVDQRQWGSPVTSGWYLCSMDEDIPTCAEDRMSISRVYPSCWMDVPAWK
jgi:hypothetical protein